MNPLKTLLGRIANGQSWQHEIRQAEFVQSALRDSLPAEIKHACEAWLSDTETLIISCPSGIVASKVRQFTPSIILHLHAAGLEVRSIRVEVQAGKLQTPIQKTKAARIIPPESVLNELEQLSTKVTSQHLSQALLKLANTLRQK
jgi:Dna[CI] antecedent, DciA